MTFLLIIWITALALSVYIFDRHYGTTLHQRFFAPKTLDTVKKQQGLLVYQCGFLKVIAVGGVISLIHILWLWKFLSPNPLSNLFLMLFLAFVFYLAIVLLGNFAYRLWQKKDPIVEFADKITRGEINATDEIKKAAERLKSKVTNKSPINEPSDTKPTTTSSEQELQSESGLTSEEAWTIINRFKRDQEKGGR